MIFGFLFASNPIRPCQNMGYGDFCNQQDTNILLVNHQIRAEALDVLFKEGTFVTEISEWRVAFLSSLTNMQNLEVFKAPKCAQKIRNTIIEIYMDIETMVLEHLNVPTASIRLSRSTRRCAVSAMLFLRTANYERWKSVVGTTPRIPIGRSIPRANIMTWLLRLPSNIRPTLRGLPGRSRGFGLAARWTSNSSDRSIEGINPWKA